MSDWTPYRTQRLVQLWREGLTNTVIAALLDTTRGSVSGKLDRLGEKRRDPHARARKELRREAYAKKPKPMTPHRPPRPPKTIASPPDCIPVTLMELPYRGRCKWPLDYTAPDGETLFCNASADGPYCSYHKALAWAPSHHKRVG